MVIDFDNTDRFTKYLDRADSRPEKSGVQAQRGRDRLTYYVPAAAG